MEQQEYDELIRRLVVVSERQATTLVGITTTLQQRIDVTLSALDATTEAIRELLTRHEATFERLGRLLDDRVPPAEGTGDTEG